MHAIDINITSKCNYKCEYCFAKSEDEGDMQEEIFLKALDFAKSMQVKYLSFCGGEPLLHKNFERLTQLAIKAGFKLILRTNGIFVDKYVDIIADNFEWVCFSLDGTTKANGKMRMAKNNLTSFQKFNIPIHNIIKLGKRSKKVKIMIASVASKINYKELPLLGKYILKNKLPISLWKIYLFKPSEGSAIAYENKYALDESNFLKLQGKLNMEELENIGVKTILQNCSAKKTDCLIITPKGCLALAQENIFEFQKNTLKEIVDFFSRLNIKNMEANRKATYF